MFALWLLSKLIAPLPHRAGVAHRDFAALLELEGDYAVHELAVQDSDWIAGHTLAELRLRDEGVVVLGIRRPDGAYDGVPHGDACVEPGDTLILYGAVDRIAELDERRRGRAGDRAHALAAGRPSAN